MKNSITLFSLLGFKVKLHVSWLVIAILLAWTLAQGYFPYAFPGLSTPTYWWMGLMGTAGLFLSIILHEFGHSLVARNYGIPMKGITLFIFGGVAEMEEEPPTAKSEFMMAIAGPVVSILLGASFYLLDLAGKAASWPVSANAVLYYLGWINIVLAAFNLVPAFPLDGGRVLRSYLWHRKGKLRDATRTASSIGSGFGVFLIALGVLSVLTGNLIGGIWWFLIGMFLRGASQMSFRRTEIRQALEGESIQRFMKTDPITVPPSISIEELVQDYVYKHHFQMFPVMDQGRLLGCVGTREVKKFQREEWGEHKVGEVLAGCSEENTVKPNADPVTVLSLMTKTGNSRLMVVDGDRLVGLISLKDLLNFLALKLDLEGHGNKQGLADDVATLARP